VAALRRHTGRLNKSSRSESSTDDDVRRRGGEDDLEELLRRGKKFYEKYLPKGWNVEFQIGLQGAMIMNSMLAGPADAAVSPGKG
jgi:hypothetical protein